MKWLQHPGMTKAVDWDVKHKFEQTGLWNWLAIKAKFHIESPWLYDQDAYCKRYRGA